MGGGVNSIVGKDGRKFETAMEGGRVIRVYTN